jgi:hypothetical protein
MKRTELNKDIAHNKIDEISRLKVVKNQKKNQKNKIEQTKQKTSKPTTKNRKEGIKKRYT